MMSWHMWLVWWLYCSLNEWYVSSVTQHASQCCHELPMTIMCVIMIESGAERDRNQGMRLVSESSKDRSTVNKTWILANESLLNLNICWQSSHQHVCMLWVLTVYVCDTTLLIEDMYIYTMVNIQLMLSIKGPDILWVAGVNETSCAHSDRLSSWWRINRYRHEMRVYHRWLYRHEMRVYQR